LKLNLQARAETVIDVILEEVLITLLHIVIISPTINVDITNKYGENILHGV
jgi:hypothetical protein